MRVLAFDHGANTGYALVVANRCLDLNSFRVKGENNREKFKDFKEKIEAIVKRTEPNLIAIEKPMSFLNANTTRILIGYYTLIQLIAEEHNIPIVEIVPTSLKKAIAGNGRADKLEVCHALLNRYLYTEDDLLEKEFYKRKKGVKNVYYDKSDALALATYAVMTYKTP